MSEGKFSDEVEAETMRQMREIAQDMGYESTLEALEDLERLRATPTAPIGKEPSEEETGSYFKVMCAANDRIAALVEALDYTLDDWRALVRIIDTNIKENDGPDRVRWEGVWYDGPLATAYLKTLRAIREMAARNVDALTKARSA